MKCFSRIKLLIIVIAITAGHRVILAQPAFVSQVNSASIKLVAGTTTTAKLNFRISPEYHIQTNDPADEALVPTQLFLESLPGIETGAPSFECDHLIINPDDHNSEWFEDILNVYFPVSVSDELRRGEYLIKGSLQYQACVDKHCLFPRNYEFVFSVLVM